MKYLLIGILISFSAIAADNSLDKLSRAIASNEMILDELYICSPLERDKFTELVRNLEERFNTTLKESYHRIRCDNRDIMGKIIEGAADRYFVVAQ